jgi:hypothetical protein
LQQGTHASISQCGISTSMGTLHLFKGTQGLFFANELGNGAFN